MRDTFRQLAADVEQDRLWDYLARMPGPRHRLSNPSAITQTLDFLRRQVRTFGWAVVDQPCVNPVLSHGTNLVATLPGRRTNALVVIGAHHDTVRQSPGADDNGSGLAGLLELARLLPRVSWEATIQLTAFDFEETEPEVIEATFAGSRTYVAALDRSIDLRAAFIFEMIGYASSQPNSQRVPGGLDRIFPDRVGGLAAEGWRGDFIAVLGNRPDLPELFTRSAASVAPALGVAAFEVPPAFPVRHMFRSDPVAFWEAGLPTLMLTDTAEFRNPHYHKASDTVETLSPEGSGSN